METVEVVIRLPKEVYEKIQQIDRIISGRRNGKTIEFTLWNGVKNGTPLPKGHSRLIETDKLISHLEAHKNLLIRHYADEGGNIPFEINSRIDQIRICMDDITNAPTIIEADKEVDHD